MLRIGVIGTGHWGENHVRVLKSLAAIGECNLVGIADVNPAKKQLAKQYDVTYYPDFKKLVKDLDAVVVAVPAGSLAEIARYCLQMGKHALVEKPFALSMADGEELVRLANKQKLRLMVGHIFLYTPQMQKIKTLIKNNTLGKIFYAYSQRLNLGIIRQDVNALWNFAPHDISIFIHIFNTVPIKVWTTGRAYLQERVEDVVFLGMEFPSGALVNSHLSWIDPVKTKKVTLVGDKSMLVWDDTSLGESLRLYNRSFVLPEKNQYLKSDHGFGEFKLTVKYGDEQIPYIRPQEPLKTELKHFIETIKNGTKPLTGGRHALAVLKVLTHAQKSLDKGGIEVKIHD